MNAPSREAVVTAATLMLFLPVAAAAAGADAPPPGQGTSPRACESKLVGKYPLPATLPADALLRDVPLRPLVQSATEVEIVCGVFSRQWKSQQTPSYLVFLETMTFRKSAEKPRLVRHQIRSALYRQDVDGQYRPVARSVEPFELPDGRELDDLDFAPYKMTESAFAFGVRTTATFTGCDSYCDGSNGFLEAFRVDGRAIRPILSTLLWSEARVIGAAKDDFSRDHATLGDTDPARISVLRTRTGGVFDWKKSKGKKTATFKWNGERYEMQDEDPVIDQSH